MGIEFDGEHIALIIPGDLAEVLQEMQAAPVEAKEIFPEPGIGNSIRCKPLTLIPYGQLHPVQERHYGDVYALVGITGVPMYQGVLYNGPRKLDRLRAA